MTRQEQLGFCNKCVSRKFDSNQGIICKLTDRIADFDGNCEKFIQDESVRPIIAEEPENEANIVWGELDDIGLKKLRNHQDFNYAIVGGLLAMLVSAVIWAVITVAAKYQIGYMALGVGLLVGFTVRYFGAGIDKKFGYLGAVLSLSGCLLGNLFSQIGFAAIDQSQSYFEIISFLNPGLIFSVLAETFQPMDLLFYGFATYEGYRFAFRPVPNNLISKLRSADFEGYPDNQKLRLPLVITGIIILSVFIFSLSRGVSGHKIYNYESGMKQAEGELKNSKPNGKWTTWYESGKMQSIGFFTAGIMDSSWKWFDENGNVSKTGKYRNELENGVWMQYFQNGVVLDSGNYLDGRKNGKWIVNYENGTLYQKGIYNRDLQEGLWETYFENGNLMSKGKMDGGIPVGKWSYFYSNGQLANELEHQSADIVLIWNSFDSIGHTYVQNGEGIYREISSKGQLLETGKVEKGHKSGKWIQYFESGKLKAEGRYVNDLYLLDNSWDNNGGQNVKNGSGKYVSFYEDGKTISETGEVKDGYKIGIWKSYYFNSEKVLQEVEYKMGIMNGIQKQYFESGSVYSEGEVTDNLHEGEWNWYFENGNNESKVVFRQNKKEGIQTVWNEDGEKLKEEYYENGKFMKVVIF